MAERAEASVGAPSRLGQEAASELLLAAGLRPTQVIVRTVTDLFADVDEVIAFSRASSFGNHLAGLSEEEQGRVREALASELEAHRTPRGLELQRHLIFAIAEKERPACGRQAGPECGPVAPAADVHAVIAARRSIRRYRPEPVEAEKLARVLEAARLAPSARNQQPWQYVVVTDPVIRRRLQAAYAPEWFWSAPVIVCACGQPNKNPYRVGAKDWRDIDVAISFDHLVLAAAAEGLGTCWIGAFDPAAVREILGIPPEFEPIVLTPLGYPDEAPAARERKPLGDIVHRDRWGGV